MQECKERRNACNERLEEFGKDYRTKREKRAEI